MIIIEQVGSKQRPCKEPENPCMVVKSLYRCVHTFALQVHPEHHCIYVLVL